MPTDNLIQSLAQGGPSVAMALFLCCLIAVGALVMLGVWLERHDEKKRQRRLAESQARARRPIVGPRWAEQQLDRR